MGADAPGKVAVIVAAAHAHPVAGRVEARPRADHQVELLRGDLAGQLPHRLADAVGAAPPGSGDHRDHLGPADAKGVAELLSGRGRMGQQAVQGQLAAHVVVDHHGFGGAKDLAVRQPFHGAGGSFGALGRRETVAGPDQRSSQGLAFFGSGEVVGHGFASGRFSHLRLIGKHTGSEWSVSISQFSASRLPRRACRGRRRSRCRRRRGQGSGRRRWARPPRL